MNNCILILPLFIAFTAFSGRDITVGYYINNSDTISESDTATVYFQNSIVFDKFPTCCYQRSKITDQNRPLESKKTEDLIRTKLEYSDLIYRYSGTYQQRKDTFVVNLKISETKDKTLPDSLRKFMFLRITENQLELLPKKTPFKWELK